MDGCNVYIIASIHTMADFFKYSFRMTIFKCNKFIYEYRLNDIDGLCFFYLATLIVAKHY